MAGLPETRGTVTFPPRRVGGLMLFFDRRYEAAKCEKSLALFFFNLYSYGLSSCTGHGSGFGLV